jgi:hypothetical protein
MQTLQSIAFVLLVYILLVRWIGNLLKDVETVETVEKRKEMWCQMDAFLTPEQQETFDERKAIMIVDGYVPEDEADALALICVLDQMPLLLLENNENNGQLQLELF